jgi:hypothetical protein
MEGQLILYVLLTTQRISPFSARMTRMLLAVITALCFTVVIFCLNFTSSESRCAALAALGTAKRSNLTLSDMYYIAAMG